MRTRKTGRTSSWGGNWAADGITDASPNVLCGLMCPPAFDVTPTSWFQNDCISDEHQPWYELVRTK
eukprot:5622655-Amphidinium_carterae.1